MKEAREDYLAGPPAAPRLWTGEELNRLPEGWRYEIDEGELVIMPPAGWEHGDVAMGVGSILRRFVRERHLGTVVAADTGFRLRRDPETLRAPDAAFVSNDRIALIADRKGFSEVPPDLAVEVLSPSNTRVDMKRKVEQYLAAGVRSVWILDPDAGALTRYRPGEAPAILDDPAAVVEDPVLPGFGCRLAELLGNE